MTGREGIVEKVVKLLALADTESGGTDSERELAAERAQRLMAKHEIEQQEILKAKGREALPGIERVAWRWFDGQGTHWIADLATLLGHFMGVDVIYVSKGSHRRHYWFVGRPELAAYVRTVVEWVEPELRRRCDAALTEAKTLRAEVGVHMSAADVRVFRRSFYDGASRSVVIRLERAHRWAMEDAGSTGTELVRSDRAAIDAYYGEDKPRVIEDGERMVDKIGVTLGQEAGDHVDVNPSNKLEADDQAPQELTA